MSRRHADRSASFYLYAARRRRARRAGRTAIIRRGHDAHRRGYELVQNDRFTEAAQESRADKSHVINFILSAIIILGITIGRGLASAIFTSGIVEP